MVRLPSVPRRKTVSAAARSLPDALSSVGIGVTVALTLAGGWACRRELRVDPARGVGYGLGIAGAAMMLGLLAYPVRKRLGAVIPGSVGFWFRLHMLLGLLGPLAILFHARFGFHAVNSGVALIAMLVVAGSGVVGRYLHIHIYRGFALRHVEAQELIEELAAARALLEADGDPGEEIRAELGVYAERVRRAQEGFWRSLYGALSLTATLRLRRGRIARSIARRFTEQARARGWDRRQLARHQREARRHLDSYFKAIGAAGALASFERLFALWHVLHLPLFGFLVVVAILHVVAVHLY